MCTRAPTVIRTVVTPLATGRQPHKVDRTRQLSTGVAATTLATVETATTPTVTAVMMRITEALVVITVTDIVGTHTYMVADTEDMTVGTALTTEIRMVDTALPHTALPHTALPHTAAPHTAAEVESWECSSSVRLFIMDINKVGAGGTS